MKFNEAEYSLLKERVEKKDEERQRALAEMESLLADRTQAEEYLLGAKEAQSILSAVARETQSQIEDHLSGIVTLALSSVEVDDPEIPKPPQFVARMVERRDGTECDLIFKEGDREQHPLNSAGFGYVDIADYALRVDYILLEEEYGSEDVRKTLISDEPFRNVDPKLQHKVSDMLRMISDKLGFQQIIVSHAEGVNISADKTFHVTKRGELSHVEVNDG